MRFNCEQTKTKKEFGALEIDWKFKPGDQGFVCPVRERKKLFFRFLQDGRFEKWFGFNDIPEVDVAAQVRAKIGMTDVGAFLRRKFWREDFVASRKDMV